MTNFILQGLIPLLIVLWLIGAFRRRSNNTVDIDDDIYHSTADLIENLSLPAKVISKSSGFKDYLSTVVDSDGDFFTIDATDFWNTFKVGDVIKDFTEPETEEDVIEDIRPDPSPNTTSTVDMTHHYYPKSN